MEKRDPSCTVGNVNLYSHYGGQHGGSLRGLGDSLRGLGLKPPYDSAFPLLGIYPEETKTEKDTHTTTFIAALFIIARHGSNPDIHQEMNG